MGFDPTRVNTMFIIVTLTAPVSGIVIGGFLVHKYCGGYDKKHSILFVAIALALSSIFVLPIYFLDNFYLISGCLWLFLFLGANAIPTIQGIAISSPPQKLRGSANSLCNLVIFGIGFSGAPFLYGFLYDHMKDYNKRLPFLLTLSFGFLGTIFSIICMFLRYRNFRQKEELLLAFENENENFNENENNNIENSKVPSEVLSDDLENKFQESSETKNKNCKGKLEIKINF